MSGSLVGGVATGTFNSEKRHDFEPTDICTYVFSQTDKKTVLLMPCVWQSGPICTQPCHDSEKQHDFEQTDILSQADNKYGM